MTDADYMRMALALAAKGAGWVSPNPMVGAVLVKGGEIIGRGYHRQYGGPHAERAALADCTVSPEGAALYVTLEPCCHHGKTPPCTQAVLASGIRRVVAGVRDPNPLMAGKGLALLRAAGVEVAEGVLEDECRALNEVFFHYIRTQTPYVVMKYAMTMDGMTATRTGQSKWITGEAARQRVHRDRGRYSAVMVGVGTVLADDPLLTCRAEGGRNPVRIVCDTHLRTPPDSQIVKTAGEVPTIIATTCADEEKRKPLADLGCRILTAPQKDGRVDLTELMALLGKEKIDSILLEGGGTLHRSFLQSGLVNKVQAYIAPKLFGNADVPAQACLLANSRVELLGGDFLIESEVARHVHGDC